MPGHSVNTPFFMPVFLAWASLAGCGARTELTTGDAGFDDSAAVPFDAGPGIPDASVADAFADVAPDVVISEFDGSLDEESDVWNRRIRCTDFTHPEDFYYALIRFTNPESGSLRLSVSVSWEATLDGYVHVYESPFTPGSGMGDCLGWSDDWVTARESRVSRLIVGPRQSVDIVVSSFAPEERGDYVVQVVTE